MAQVVIWLTLVLLLSAVPARAGDVPMRKYFLILVALLPSPVLATDYYADNLVSCTATYNPSTRACDGNSGNSYTTLSAAVAPLNPGDTLYIRQFSGGAGVWNAQIDLVTPNKTGTAGSPITIEGYPGETVTLRYSNPSFSTHGATRSRGARGYITFKNMVWDGINQGPGTQAISISDGNHHFILDGIEIKNWDGTASGFNGDNNIIVRCIFHDNISTDTLRHYGVYGAAGTNNVIEYNTIYHNSGGGIQLYNATSNLPLVNTIVRYNRIYENNSMSNSQVGGIIVLGSSTVPINGMEIYGNVVYRNGKGQATSGGGADGINLSAYVSGAKVHNNVVYDNQRYGINFGTPGVAAPDVHNNIIISNDTQEYRDFGSSTVSSHNACTTAISCGSNKITIAAASDCLITAGDDYRLKQGSNVCRDAGTAVSTRPARVGVTDIGAYEQGALSSAVVVGGYIEVNASVMTPSLTPASGVSGFTIACVGCTGSPVVSQAVLKAGSSTVLQLTVSGLTTSGSCTLSLGSTNLKDSGYIGPASLGLAQGLNSVSGLAVSGTCANTVAGGGAPTPTHSRFQLDEGSGTVANDDTGNGNHGTVSSGVTWVTGANGTGVTIPTDATFRHVATTYGAGVNPSTQSFAQCAKVIPDTALAPKVYLSAGGNGTNQRAYVGITSVGGQVQWSIGIQASGFSSSGSEFPVKNQMTLICLVFDSTTDTATLWVDGVKGTLAGKSVKSYTSYTLVDNLRIGNDGTFTVNNGGFTVYMVWTWNTKPSDADLEALYASEFPAGSAVSCYGQATHKAEHVYTDGTNPIAYGQPAASAYEVVDGGGIAAVIQIDCTGTAGGPVTLRFYYSTNGTDFDNEIPAMLGAGGIAMWGQSTELGLNHGVATCCISGGLTANHGVTLVSANVSPTINLSTNHSYTIRLLLRFASGLVGQSIWIVAKEDTGLDLANAPTLGPMRFNLVPARGGGMR